MTCGISLARPIVDHAPSIDFAETDALVHAVVRPHLVSKSHVAYRDAALQWRIYWGVIVIVRTRPTRTGAILF